MTVRRPALAVLPVVALAAVMLAGCGQHGHSAAPAGGTSPVPTAPSASQLAHMNKLVDDADSAAAAAESDAASDK